VSESVRAQPFYCPYCGEPDIRPAEEPRAYHCATCDRRWTLRYQGLGEGTAAPGRPASGVSA
jgi:transposase-like protein